MAAVADTRHVVNSADSCLNVGSILPHCGWARGRNCSDLRGSADYSAYCGGATEHGISTANRFRPLKREQLHVGVPAALPDTAVVVAYLGVVGPLCRLKTVDSGILFVTSFRRVVSAGCYTQRSQGAFDCLVAEPCFLQHGPTGIVVPADRWSGRWGVKPQSKWDSTQRYPGWHPRSIGVPAMVAVLTPDRVKTSGPSLPDQSGSTTWAGGLRGWM